MITFTQVHENSPVKVIVELDEHSSLPQVVEAFEQFLLACGFNHDQVKNIFVGEI